MFRYSNHSVTRLLLSLTFLFVYSACRTPIEDTPEPEPEEEVTMKSYANVDAALWPFFEAFEKEGEARGINVDLSLSLITGDIEEIAEQHVAGQCTYSSNHPNHVTIDLEFWENASDLFKEFIIFHELGHCYLARDHREDANANGTCKSLMRSGVEDCRDNYNVNTRDRYIDELFNPGDF